jgi:hypothetical protein
MRWARVFGLSPSAYSFFAGALVSLAGNLFAAVALAGRGAPAVPMPAAKQVYPILLLLAASAVFFLFISARLEELRAIQRSLKPLGNDPGSNDFGDLLRSKGRLPPLKWALIAATVLLAVSAVLLGKLIS